MAAARCEGCDGVRRHVYCLLLALRTQDPTRTPCSSGPAILETHAASRKSSEAASYEALTLRQVQGAVASVSLTSQCGQSHQEPMRISSYRLCRCTRKAGFFSGQLQKRTFTGGEVRSGPGHGVNRSGKHRGSFSSAADQEENGSSDLAAMPSCNTFRAPVTHALELSLRRTRRECGKTG